MRKEIIFAIILGIALGGIILYGSYIANQAATNTRADSSAPSAPVQYTNSTPSADIRTNPTFSLSFPTANYVTFTDTLKLTGSAPAGSTIAIISETGETFTEADQNGHFEADVTLISGENEITLTTQVRNQPETIKSTVIYTTADINLDTPTSNEK